MERDDYEYQETPVKNKGKSSGRKGNVAPKTYTVPDLINEGDYSNVKAPKGDSNSGGPGTKGRAGWRAKNKSGSPDNQGMGPGPVKYQAPKNVGKASIDELPGQMTKPVPVPKKPGAPRKGK
jgi:hypothetical protein